MTVASGVPGFDELVGGGLLENRLYVLSGPPGSGKTTFSAQFATEGVSQGQSCMYITMHETEDELRQDMSQFGFGFDRAAGSDGFRFVNLVDKTGNSLTGASSERAGVSALTNKIVAYANSKKVDRLIIDSTMLLDHFFADAEGEVTQFLTALKQGDATTLLISEMVDPSAYSDEHFLAHGVVFFHNFLDSTGMTRGVQVVKMRGTNVDTEIRPLSFSERGLRVDPEGDVEV
ncbi:MAG: RAD55 family ATPase [Haloferacaceae archaeon]